MSSGLNYVDYKKSNNVATHEQRHQQRMLQLMNPTPQLPEQSLSGAEQPSSQQNYKAMADRFITLLSDIQMNDGVTITTQFYNPNIIRITFNNGPYKNFKYLVYFSIKLPEKIFSGNTQDVRPIDMEKINKVLATFGGKRRNKSRRFKRLRRSRRSKKTNRK